MTALRGPGARCWRRAPTGCAGSPVPRRSAGAASTSSWRSLSTKSSYMSTKIFVDAGPDRLSPSGPCGARPAHRRVGRSRGPDCLSGRAYNFIRPRNAVVVASAVQIVTSGTRLGLRRRSRVEPGTYARFDTTEGSFTVRLFDKEAPNTVANFVGLAEGTKEWRDPASGEKKKAPYYDGVIFHRVINGFMIQGGDRLGTGTGGPGYNFADEFHPSRRHTRRGHPLDGQRRTEHQRQPVLHHARSDAASRQPPLRCSARSSKGSTWCRRLARCRPGGRIARSSPS